MIRDQSRRRRRRPCRLLLLTASLGVAACQEPEQPLLGEWLSVGTVRPAMTYVVDNDGILQWIVDLPEGPDTIVVGYHVDYTTTPIQLDVGPWATGPIAGRTLFGIAEIIGPDRFRVDFEPGDPDAGVSQRPSEFSVQAVTFVRKHN